MLNLVSEPVLVAIVGLVGGLALGLAARLGRFCTLGAIEDYFYGGTDTRLRMWMVAIGIAVTGSFVAVGAGYLTLADTIYLSGWNPFAAVVGGALFGYGMAMSGNCGYGALARLGGGDLRSFVIVLVMGLAAYATMSGPLAALRMFVFPPLLDGYGGLAGVMGAASGLSPVVIGIVIGLCLIVMAVSKTDTQSRKTALIWGAVVGGAVVSGWIGSQWVATHGFDAVPVESHTFSAPIGEAMLYLMTSSGSTLSFGIGSVAGVLGGAFIGSLIKGHFRWEACEDPRELTRQIGGACLMGIGAVIAMGCSVGQGISAFSVLALSAPLTLGAIVLGAKFGLEHLIAGFDRI